ncbi:MAG: glycosyltransferase family 2 protein [Candidatus Electrothrix sp. AW1]|nr:glycosyltransferase family 2 protein [Candidatus Electrothrix sp. AX1]MCI5181167.1 glycosyltransferase family 2 protein [Candidatus Electrothrix gigas]
MTSNLVSVILPVHNGADYIHEAIASVLGQTYLDFELIIIDDCSTDATVNIIQSFQDTRLRLISSHKRLGICNALNIGLKNANGLFIARMDADDICHPSRLERQILFLQKHQNIGFCGSWVQRFGEKQHPQRSCVPVGPMRVKAFAVYDNPMVHSSVMLRRKVLQNVEPVYRDDFAHAEDFDLWTRLLKEIEGDNLSETLLDYRVHNQSVTVQKSEAMDRTACRILKRQLNFFGLNITQNEVMQHRRWATGRLDYDNISQDIEAAEKWLIRLLEANLKSLACDPNAFLWATRKIWFALCYKVQAAGQPIMQRFLHSPISRGDWKAGLVLLGAITKRRL